MEEESQPTILIVNDNHEQLELLSILLRKAGYGVITASGGHEALKAAQSKTPQLIISDVSMPDGNGVELCRLIRAEAGLHSTPILLASAILVDSTSAVEGLQAGADDYLEIPFDPPRLVAKVARLIERKRAEENLERCVIERTAELRAANEKLEREMIERQRAQEAACYDALTGLPNRIVLKDRLPHELALAARDGRKVAVMFLDVDRFKAINDTLGPSVGDRLLRRVAERLAGCVRGSDTIARLGGDEFALLLTRLRYSEDAARIARRTEEVVAAEASSILKILEPPFDFEEHMLYLTASIGISIYPDDGDDADTLLKNAGSALHRAREQGGNSYQFYTADMNEKALKRLVLENNMRRALERNEFIVHYQPKMNIDSGQIVGMEALVRWQHPELGLVPPADFIPLAEDTGIIVPLGEWVLRTACSQSRKWQEAGLAPMKVSVNLSARQFQQSNLIEMITQALAESGLAPGNLELELTESAVMTNSEGAVQTLQKIKELGVDIAIDDFGTGYSSLSYLQRLPVDALKIDRSFVKDTTTDPDDAAIVMAIIGLAHNLKLKVIAEGVETEEQLTFLRLLRCDEMQGYLLSKPLSANGFESFNSSSHALS